MAKQSVQIKDLKISFDGKVIYDPLSHQVKFHTSPAKYRLFGGSAGGGKVVSNNGVVLTPFGWKKGRDLEVGDLINNPDGSVQKIVQIHPEVCLDKWVVHFSDGTKTEVAKDHLWLAWRARGSRKIKGGRVSGEDSAEVVETQMLQEWIERGYTPQIPVCEAQSFNVNTAEPNPLDPYLLGIILGGGTTTQTNVIITCDNDDQEHYRKELGETDVSYRDGSVSFTGELNKYIKNRLELYGLLGLKSHEKFIPHQYLWGSTEKRLGVLQGLMDTDGYSSPDKNQCEYTTTSKQLSEDVSFVVRSLGGTVTVKTKVGSYKKNGKKVTCRKAYRLYIRFPNPDAIFRMKRKQHGEFGRNLVQKSVTKVEVDGKIKGRCITVSNPNGLYITNDFIVTHNSYAVIGEAIMRSLKYDFPLTGAIFRRSYPELESTIIRTMLEILPKWFYKYNQSQHVMTLKNGSRIEFCYAESDNDVIRYQSREWDWLGIDELTHFSLYQWTYLLSRLRTSKPINTKFFAASNPGGRGHVWVRNRWVTKTCEDSGYQPEEYDFIPAGVKDNPYIMENNPDYLENLQMLPEAERKALLEGDWNVFEGQFFTEWSTSRHITDDFDVPEDWRLIMGWDDGTREPRAVYLLAIDNDQRVWVVWEYYRAEENLKEAAENIRRQLKEEGLWGRIYKCVVDPSMKRVDSQTGLSSVDVLEGMGYGFGVGQVELGNNNRVEGWRVMKSYMAHKPYEEPMLKIFRSCENMIRTIPQLVYYTTRSGRTSKKEDLDTTQEDHAADAVRYALMSLDMLPSRFNSSSSIEIKKRAYRPKSSFN